MSMSFELRCPNCGERPVDEFRFGGEYHARPSEEVPAEEWADYLYARRNLDGPQEEWWFHRLGCRRWFLAHRDTRDNRVLATWWPKEIGTADKQR
jgi:heterotetrameric sarcosine oxidase delta subunit